VVLIAVALDGKTPIAGSLDNKVNAVP